MIQKIRSIPLKVHFNHALISRLLVNHPKIPIIQLDTRKKMSGYNGEVNTDFHLQFLNDRNHYIFLGLRLPHPHHPFQIDTLILSRKFILIIETKNLSGTININESQFSQTTEHGEKGYNNPLLQVQRHKEQLQDWLNAHQFDRLPILVLVALSNPSAIIKTNNPKVKQHICKIDNLKNQIMQLVCNCGEDILTERELKKLTKLLLKEDTPHIPEIQKSYQLSHSDLIKGVRCPSCSSYQMHRKIKSWHCPHCLYQSQNAHKDAFLDYFLLVNTSITNKELRDFLGISSIKVASNLLASSNFPFTGTKKGRVYDRPANFLSLLEARYLLQKQKTKA
ncbi:nuclease-related domain-containing protein [Mesobacillus foraminis]|uniref:nuclease-related domain-containing protein n=1 Tax=Mesobacillus foraminis TaxID=279826 RepID=UPI0039A3109B